MEKKTPCSWAGFFMLDLNLSRVSVPTFKTTQIKEGYPPRKNLAILSAL